MGNTIEFMLSAKRYVSAAKRFFKKRVRACLGYSSLDTAERTIQGVEVMNTMRKGQVKRLDRSDAIRQAKFVENLFYVAAWTWSHS